MVNLRKINLNDKHDLQMLMVELALIDPSHTLQQGLASALMIHDVERALAGKPNYREGDFVPVPEAFVKGIKMFRDKTLNDTIPKIENLIQMLEEGV